MSIVVPVAIPVMIPAADAIPIAPVIAVAEAVPVTIPAADAIPIAPVIAVAPAVPVAPPAIAEVVPIAEGYTVAVPPAAVEPGARKDPSSGHPVSVGVVARYPPV